MKRHKHIIGMPKNMNCSHLNIIILLEGAIVCTTQIALKKFYIVCRNLINIVHAWRVIKRYSYMYVHYNADVTA